MNREPIDIPERNFWLRESAKMDREAQQELNNLNAHFYRKNAASFSQTRNAPWTGWARCMTACELAPTEPQGEPPESAPTSENAQSVAAETSATSESRRSNDSKEFTILDIACGNLRFEAFLEENYPGNNWEFFAIDNCEPLVWSSAAATEGDSTAPLSAEKINFTCEDIIANMLEDSVPFEPANTSDLARNFPFDIVVSFGFMHHIPGYDLRVKFLKHALNYVKPGGYLVVSFWQFLNDETKRSKIERTHTEALEYFSPEVVEENLKRRAESLSSLNDTGRPNTPEGFPTSSESLSSASRPIITPESLEPGDYFLGWKDLPGQYRYCHHFTDEEIDRLIAEITNDFTNSTLVDSFTADGKTNNLNRYVVLGKTGLFGTAV